MPSSRLGSVPGPPEPLVELPPPVRLVTPQPSRDDGTVVARFDQCTRCSGETPSTAVQNLRSCVEDLKFAVAPRTFADLGISTLDDLCGSLADRGNLLLATRLGLCLLCWRRTRQLTPSPWRSSTGDLTT